MKRKTILYTTKNKPELGYFIKYTRKGYYDFGIGDYTIPTDFSIAFEHSEEIIRFGTVYSGETHLKLKITLFHPLLLHHFL